MSKIKYNEATFRFSLYMSKSDQVDHGWYMYDKTVRGVGCAQLPSFIPPRNASPFGSGKRMILVAFGAYVQSASAITPS